MEGLLILIGLYVLDVVIKKVIANKKNETSQAPKIQPPQNQKPQKLTDLVRQFEEAQRQAAQGNMVPPVPQDSDDSDDYEDEDERDNLSDNRAKLPVVPLANPNRITFKEIAESVIQWEEVCVEYLQQAFGFSDVTAKQVLAQLQAHHIVGRDMGDGYCDLLVHDKIELINLFNREKREADAREAEAAREQAVRARREEELKHQQELAKQEERARELREKAGGMEGLPDASEGIESPCLNNSDHRKHNRTFNHAEIRRGFIWAKVLDEPRFKKHWSSRVR